MNIKNYFPVFTWLPEYKKEYLKGDISAGLTVGVMLIPQGMAYAYIAGLPPEYGLYAALLPQVIYALMGTSRQLAVGPVAMDSLLVAAGVSAVASVGSEEYISLAILLAFLMGLVQFLAGLVRLGFLVNFLSRPVISGFTSAAALIIGLNQLKHLMGTDLPRSNKIYELFYHAFQHITETHVLTFLIGLGGILIIKFVKKINKSIPAALVVVLIGTLLVAIFRLDIQGVKIVQDIPSGLPSLGLPDFQSDKLKDLLPVVFTLALIAFMEAISVAKAIQARHKEYEIDANQELIALGLSNMIGSLFKSYPTTGGFSRSAVNEQAGAKTGVAPIISAVLIALTLLFLTPLFYYLPKAVLASIIMVAVFGLIDTRYPRFLWKNKKDELLMYMVTFIITLTIGISQGILFGVIISFVIIIYHTTFPHYAILGYFQGSNEYRNIKRFKEVITRKDILIIRYDASLYFANSNHFKDTLQSLVNEKGEELKLVILNAESIDTIDSSAMEMLKDLMQTLQTAQIQFYWSGVKGPVRDILNRADLVQKIGEEHFFLDIQAAVDYYDNTKDDWVKFSNLYAKQHNS